MVRGRTRELFGARLQPRSSRMTARRRGGPIRCPARCSARLESHDYNGNAMAGSEIIFIVDESPEGGYEARALDESIYTQADTFDALKDMVRDAVRCHFEEG